MIMDDDKFCYSPAKGLDRILEYLLSIPHMEHLLNYPDARGNSPAHLAALRNWPNCLKVLIERFANFHRPNYVCIALTTYVSPYLCMYRPNYVCIECLLY